MVVYRVGTSCVVVVRRGGMSFVVLRRSLWWCVVRCGTSFVVVRRSLWCVVIRRSLAVAGGFRLLLAVRRCGIVRTVTWRQASPLGRGAVGARRQPPAGGRRW
jgi:hypothetical protein